MSITIKQHLNPILNQRIYLSKLAAGSIKNYVISNVAMLTSKLLWLYVYSYLPIFSSVFPSF